MNKQPIIWKAKAPNRILDIGGWTDTHFAKKGAVLNFAVDLFARVNVQITDSHEIIIRARDYGADLKVDLDDIQYNGEHDLLKAALKTMGIDHGLIVEIYADVPPGCGTGTSAAVSVALLGVLFRVKGLVPLPEKIAQLAHRLETEELGYESGIQDQFAATLGGINLLDIYKYPFVSSSKVCLNEEILAELESRLLIVFEGSGHSSSEIHKDVIEQIKQAPETKGKLKQLAALPLLAVEALHQGNLLAFANCMNENNHLQKLLHPEISTQRIERIEKIALRHGAIACKINGAGGGGSVTVLADAGGYRNIAEALERAGFQTRLVNFNFGGLQTWQSYEK